HYQYTVTGNENNGQPGRVNIEAISQSKYYYDIYPNKAHYRSAAIIVNHYNNLIVSPSIADGTTVTGVIELSANAAYTGDVEAEFIEEGGPPKGMGIELWMDGKLFDQKVEPPGNFVINTQELTNGPHEITIKVYDYLYRCAEESITLTVDNAPQQEIAGNLLVDGNMEGEDLGPWVHYGGTEVTSEKVSGAEQRAGGSRALKITAVEQGASNKGVYQYMPDTGLVGGEELTISLWIKTNPNQLTTQIGGAAFSVYAYEPGMTIISDYALGNPDHYQKYSYNFINPEGNTRLLLHLKISDKPADGTPGRDMLMEAWFDDVILCRATDSLEVESPQDFTAISSGSHVVLSWNPFDDITIERTEIFRRQVGQEWSEFWPIARLDRNDIGFYTGNYIDLDVGDGTGYEYRLVHVDATGQNSEEAVTTVIPSEEPLPKLIDDFIDYCDEESQDKDLIK
ncbi:MAG: carbohydrate binding domain-containing protein, partial [Thermoplasmatales archaeon]|nr:carbohydrate binding domain-containing protein [Thermoplasmatales archaeon]